MKIILPWKIKEYEKEYLKEKLPEDELLFFPTSDPKDILDEELSGVEIIIAGLADKGLIERCPDLKLIQSMIAGVSHIDLEAAYKREIPVSSAKGANSYVVAEHALMLMLNLAKNTRVYIKQAEEMRWEKRYSSTLSGKTLGIVGLGHIGSATARAAKCLGMHIAAVRYHPEKGDNEIGVSYLGSKKDILDLAEISDYLVVSVPKTKETISLINDNVLEAMQKDSFLINISRGPIVDMNALYSALSYKKISGFATDVYDMEPNDFSHGIFRLDNVIATPHVAAYVMESKIRCLDKVAENITLFKKNQFSDFVDYKLGY